MTQQHGRRFEHDLTTELAAATTDDVWVRTVGYSGNSAVGGSDLVVTVNPTMTATTTQYNIEAKKRQAESGKRCSHVFSGSENDETGVEELSRFIRGTPSWGVPVVVLSFDRRAPITLDARVLATSLDESSDGPIAAFSDVGVFYPSETGQTVLDATAPRLTPSDNISMVKPDTDTLSSSTAAPEDGVCVAETLRLPRSMGDDTTPIEVPADD